MEYKYPIYRQDLRRLSKIERQQVYDKCEGHCAYCGKEITIKQMQVDHLIPIEGNVNAESIHGKPFSHDMDNWMPSCARCNRYKSNHRIEFFRSEVQKQVSRARATSWNYNMALDYGLILETGRSVVFYFEQLTQQGDKTKE